MISSEDPITLKKLNKRQFTERYLDLLCDPAGYIQAFVFHELQGFHLEHLLNVETALESVYVLGLQLIEQDREIANPSVWIRKMTHRMLLLYHRQFFNLDNTNHPIRPEILLPLESLALHSGIFVYPEQP